MKELFYSKKFKFYAYTAVALFLFYSFAEYFAYPETVFKRMKNSFFLVSYVTILNYLFFERVLPLFKVSWKHILTGIALTGMLIFLYSFGLYGWRSFWIQQHVYTDFTPGLKFLNAVATHSRFSIMSLLFFGIAHHFYNYYKLTVAAKQLRIEKQEAELNYLKSQMNPHFLFNTLNNIYSLARDKNDLAPESILRLSKILRFMLYETGGDFVTVEQEQKVINDYIALEKLRYDDSLRVNFDCGVEDLTQPIPPLLLIPLVENAFKHGVSETRGDPFIDIELSIRHQQLSFVIKNSTLESQKPAPVRENIGLSNMRKQLELLYKRYQLSVQQEGTVFTSRLNIDLSSHV
jgi:LytS/YehU family sensor histidine kinase